MRADPDTFGLDLFIGEPDLVGRGIGTRVVDLVCTYLEHDRGASAVALTTERTNLRAQRAYEKAGFRKVREVLDTDTRERRTGVVLADGAPYHPRMTEHTIPLITVRGSYAEVGAAIGDACAATIERECDTARWEIPSGRSVKDQLALADRYAEVTRPLLPWVFEELDGCAEAVGVDPRALWAACIEEIWYEPRIAGQVGAAIDGRCSDLVAGRAARPPTAIR